MDDVQLDRPNPSVSPQTPAIATATNATAKATAKCVMPTANPPKHVANSFLATSNPTAVVDADSKRLVA